MRPLILIAVLALLPLVATAGKAKNEDTIVYRTRHGVKYHMLHCHYVRRGASPVTLKRAKELSLDPCKRCKPPVLDVPQLASSGESFR